MQPLVAGQLAQRAAECETRRQAAWEAPAVVVCPTAPDACKMTSCQGLCPDTYTLFVREMWVLLPGRLALLHLRDRVV